jgi:hypothetical protein
VVDVTYDMALPVHGGEGPSNIRSDVYDEGEVSGGESFGATLGTVELVDIPTGRHPRHDEASCSAKSVS